jgi:hypothetical protein
LHVRGRLQRELPGHRFPGAAFLALQHLPINETLVPSAMTASQMPATFLANRHSNLW